MSNHAEVWIAEMIARAVSANRTAMRVLLLVAALGLAGAGRANAADPPPGPLDRPLADVALVDSGLGPETPPLLLTLDTTDLTPGTVRVALLDRSRDWRAIASRMVTLFDAGEGGETPWLVQLGPDRFVILATSHGDARTMLVPVRVIPGGGAPLDVGTPAPLDMAVDDAGASDVDGDGRVEVVVSSATTTRGGDVCQGSLIRVLDGSSLAERGRFTVPNMRLGGGVLGEWDGGVGGDLLAYAYGNCPAGPDSAQRLGVLALSLDDGMPIVTTSLEDPSGSVLPPGIPLAADLDGDGRDEVVIRDGGVLVLLEPARRWARTEIARGDVLPLVALAPDGLRQAGVVVWLAASGAEDDLAVAMANVDRTADGSLGLDEERLDLAAVAPDRRSRMLRAIWDAAVEQEAPQSWVGDVDRDGCPEILAPLFFTDCAGDDDLAMKVGAAWFATRPVAVFDVGGRRDLLIASTDEWVPSAGVPEPATPAAIARPGAWRHGPSARFALSELRAGDAAYFRRYPVPRPTIERAPIRSEKTDFPGFTGARVLVRVVGARPGDPPPSGAPTLDAFLSDPPADGEKVTIARIAVPAGAETGRDGSFVHLSLADVLAPDGGPAERWTVTVAQVNDWGEMSNPVRGTVVRDLTGPSLTVDPPFLSAPWPFEATVDGRSEPGVEIRGGRGGPVVSDRRGRFVLRTQLAPWPQAIELTAVDDSGNTTTRSFSLVGGVDYRALPWPAIVVVLLLLGAVLSSGRGTQAIRGVEATADDEPQPEIEELPPAGEWPRG